MTVISKQIKAKRRARRGRAKIFGTSERPRLSVYVSLNNMFVQLIDDTVGRTLLSARGADPAALGKLLAEQAFSAGIKAIVFDRGAKKYHGRVQALAEALRAGGLNF